MFNLFLIIHAILALVLIVIILLQRSDGGALGGIGGGSFSGMLTGRSSANFLTKFTAVIAALFLGNSLLLAILSGNLKNKSIVKVYGNSLLEKHKITNKNYRVAII